VSFEVVFFENTTDLLFNYAQTAFGGTCTASDNGATAGVGVQATAKVAQQLSFKSPSLTANSAVTWKSTLLPNVVPSITAVSPKSWVTDISDIYVELTGTRFNYTAVALVNGVPVPTYIFSSTDLLLQMPASNLTAAGTTLQISVFNGAPGGGPSPAVAFPINAPDFTLGASISNPTVKLGQSTTATIYADPNPAFQPGITLSCSGLPSSLTCTFDPARILAGGFAVVTFTAKAASSSSATLPLSASLSTLFPILGFLFVAVPKSARRLCRRITQGLFLLSLALILSCGGGGGSPSPSGSSTPPGTGGAGGTTTTPTATTGNFSITVTGTSGSIQHSVKLNLTVTQ